jgi:hypothetical protein
MSTYFGLVDKNYKMLITLVWILFSMWESQMYNMWDSYLCLCSLSLWLKIVLEPKYNI